MAKKVVDNFNNNVVLYTFEHGSMRSSRTLQHPRQCVGTMLTGFVSVKITGGHSSSHFLSLSVERQRSNCQHKVTFIFLALEFSELGAWGRS